MDRFLIQRLDQALKMRENNSNRPESADKILFE